jgi:site-specific recombinase XerD
MYHMTMVKKRHPTNPLDDLIGESQRRARDLFPLIEGVQRTLRLYDIDRLAPVLRAVREQDALLRRVTGSLSALAVDPVDLRMAGEAASTLTKAVGLNATAIARALTMQTQMAAALDTPNVSGSLDLAKAMRTHMESAAMFTSTLASSGVFSAAREAADRAALLHRAVRDLGQITKLLPLEAFARVGEMAESLRVLIPTLPAIDSSLLGLTRDDSLAAAVARLRARAESVASDPDATVSDVESLASDVEAVTTSVPAHRHGEIKEYLLRVLLWLVREVRNDAAKYAIYHAAVTLYLISALVGQPPDLPSVPSRPPALGAPTPGGVQSMGAPGTLLAALPPIIQRAGLEAQARTLEFLASVRNHNTRDAYVRALVRFTNWCEDRQLELVDITAFTVSAYISEIERDYRSATVRQHLVAIRLLFDHLVVGGVVPVNPASEARGPNETGRRRKAAPQPQEIRRLLDSIDAGEMSGLRDRALIAVMVYGFARVSPLVAMDVKDYIDADGGRSLRLHEKGGRTHELPAHRRAQEYLDAYLDAAGLAGALNSPLWRTMAKDGSVSDRRMSRMDVYRAVKRRAVEVGLGAVVTCQGLRAAGITAYLSNGGSVKSAQSIAAHASPRTTKRYQPARSRDVPASEIEKIGI